MYIDEIQREVKMEGILEKIEITQTKYSNVWKINPRNKFIQERENCIPCNL